MDVWNSGEFRTGLGAGVAAAGLLLLAAVAARRTGREGGRTLPAGGLVFAAAGLWAIGRSETVPGAVVVAVAGIAAVTALGGLRSVPAGLAVVASLPFAWLIAFRSGVDTPTWANLAVLPATALGAACAAALDDGWRDDAPGPILLAGAVGGVYLTVPDTEHALALLGTALPLALLGWPLRFVRLGRAGAAAAVAALMWAGLVGAVGRPPAVPGMIACLGLLATEPLGRALRRDRNRGEEPRGATRPVAFALLFGGHAVAVLLAARVAGIRRETAPAVVLAVAAGAISLALGALAGAHRPAGPPRSIRELA